MTVNLSFVYPVHNAETTLASGIRRILDLLADLSVGFELLLIDDGSTDDTLGEAREIQRCFSQVQVISRPLRYGHSAAVQLGLRKSRGAFVMIYNNRNRPISTEILDLWKARFGDRLVATSGRAAGVTPADFPLPPGISHHGTILELGGLILVQRMDASHDVSYLDFVRFPNELRRPNCFAEPISGPHFLSPAGIEAASVR